MGTEVKPVTNLAKVRRKRLYDGLMGVLSQIDIALGYVACNYGHKDPNVHERTDLALVHLHSAIGELEKVILKV